MDPQLTTTAIDTATLAAHPEASPMAYTATGGYAAVEQNGERSRRSPAIKLLSEDHTLTQKKRAELTANAREASRNMCVAQWAVNKHLDYVSRFRFRATTGDEGYNRELEAAVAEFGRREQFDLAMRHPLRRALRLTEAHAVIDGDAGWLKHAGRNLRGRIELIEGDRIRDKELKAAELNQGNWINGVEVEPRSGRARKYAIANRTKRGYERGRVIAAKHLITRGYYTRFDQVRGITPFACALNTLRDTDETFDFARAKIKLAQMLGIAFTRSTDGPLGEVVADTVRNEGEIETPDGQPRYDVGLEGGLWSLDLDRGDGVEMVESRTPSNETVNFLRLMVHVAIRSLDLPYSFWDESFTNFYGQRGSFLAYIQSCEPKRADNQELLGAWSAWRLGLAVADGSLELPSGWDFSDLAYEWIPVGQPWWDPLKEISAQLMAIGAGLTSPQAVCHATNSDYEQNIDAIAAAMQYADDKGVALSFDTRAAQDVAMAEMRDEAEAAAKKQKQTRKKGNSHADQGEE